MPIYEYQCKKCNDTTEILQKFSDPPLAQCPDCGGQMEKLMSMNSFQLKGSGWYVTDYKNKSKPADSTAKDTCSASKDTCSASKEKTAVTEKAMPQKEAATPPKKTKTTVKT